jgi:hypothetical protein
VDTRRSYYLACRQDDFAEAPRDLRTPESYEILIATPANDNSLSKARLARAAWSFFVACWNRPSSPPAV